MTCRRQVGSTIAEVRFAMRNLKSWMRAESVDTPPVLQMGSSRVERIPKGVAGSVALGDVGGSRIRKSQLELRVPHILKMLKICQFISIGVPGGDRMMKIIVDSMIYFMLSFFWAFHSWWIALQSATV